MSCRARGHCGVVSWLGSEMEWDQFVIVGTGQIMKERPDPELCV